MAMHSTRATLALCQLSMVLINACELTCEDELIQFSCSRVLLCVRPQVHRMTDAAAAGGIPAGWSETLARAKSHAGGSDAPLRIGGGEDRVCWVSPNTPLILQCMNKKVARQVIEYIRGEHKGTVLIPLTDSAR
jgi:hypothetical protein